MKTRRQDRATFIYLHTNPKPTCRDSKSSFHRNETPLRPSPGAASEYWMRELRIESKSRPAPETGCKSSRRLSSTTNLRARLSLGATRGKSYYSILDSNDVTASLIQMTLTRTRAVHRRRPGVAQPAAALVAVAAVFLSHLGFWAQSVSLLSFPNAVVTSSSSSPPPSGLPLSRFACE